MGQKRFSPDSGNSHARLSRNWGSFYSMRSILFEKRIGEKDCVAHNGEWQVDRGKNPFSPMRHEVVGSGSVECLSNSLDIAFHTGIGLPAIDRQQCRATGANKGDQRQKGSHNYHFKTPSDFRFRLEEVQKNRSTPSCPAIFKVATAPPRAPLCWIC